MDCIFCKIANKETPSDIVYEDENFLAFKDINPKAPIHILIIPKIHIATVNDFKAEDKELIGSLILVAKIIAKAKGITDSGYKLIFNVGKRGGQNVFHLHLHLLGGWQGKN